MTTTVHGPAGVAALAGTDLGHTEWVRVDGDRVASFAHATDGHTDAHGDGPLGGPVADGFHTLGLVGTLVDRLLEFRDIRMNVIYGVNRVRLPGPVPVGARVRLHAEVGEVRAIGEPSDATDATEVPAAVEMLVNATVEVEDEPKPACVAQVVYRIYG